MSKLDDAFAYATQALFDKNRLKQIGADASKSVHDTGEPTMGQRNFSKNFGRSMNGIGGAASVGAAIDMAKKMKSKGVMGGYADTMGLETKDPTKDYE